MSTEQSMSDETSHHDEIPSQPAGSSFLIGIDTVSLLK